MNCRTGSDKAHGTAPSVRACTETTGRTLRTRIAFKPAPNGASPTNTTRRRNGGRFLPEASEMTFFQTGGKCRPPIRSASPTRPSTRPASSAMLRQPQKENATRGTDSTSGVGVSQAVHPRLQTPT